MSEDNLSFWEQKNAYEIKDYLEKYGVAGIDNFLKTKLDDWKNVEINIAITGTTGSGKSSFINAIRG